MRLRFDDFVLEPETRQLFRGGDEVHLKPKAFELLELLLRSRPRALTKLQIRRHLWPETTVGDASLTVLVAELRAALGDDAKEPRFLRTVHGFGYAFAGEASEEGVGDGPSAEVAPRVLWGRRVIPLVEGENVLGRDEGVTVRIDTPGVSRRHARIRVVRGGVTIEDLGSKNGTFVGENDQPIAAPTALPDGARFWLGQVVLIFRCSPEKGSTLTERRA